ncbi:MAG: M20 family metallopeptidase [Anaerolineales bacterium]
MLPSAQELVGFAKLYEESAVTLIQDLVRIPSVNGRDFETPVARRVRQEAEDHGLSAKLLGTDENRQNVLVEIGGGSNGFAFIGHMDTVAEGDHDLWNHDPFEGVLSRGKIYGRGTADNKAGIVCGLFALVLLQDHGLIHQDQMSVVLAGVVDEESGASSPLGVRYLLDDGSLDVSAAIYTYASDVICIGHRGLLRMKIRTTGEAVHSGSGAWDRGEEGVNAVTGLAAILLRLEELNLETSPHPAFPGLGAKITPGTIISGGDWEGMVPAWAEAIVDIRLMPDQLVNEVLAIIEAIVEDEIALRPGLSVEIEEKTRLPGVAISEDHNLVNIAKRYTFEVTGNAWKAVGAGPANEGYMLIEAGIPTLCGFGPTGGNAHAVNEWVTVSSLAPTIAMFAGIAQEFLRGIKE